MTSQDGSAPAVTVGHVSFANSRSRTQKTSERVALDLVRDIVARGLRTGARLPLEAEMVEHYGVSRASLREALRLLEVQGLIWLKPGPGGGPVVGAVEPSHLARTAALYFHVGAATYDDVMRTQAMLEPLCAEHAARNPDRHGALEPFLQQEMPDDETAFRAITGDFHGTIYALAANPVLSLLTQAVTHIVTHHVVTSMDPVELRPQILEEHTELARVIASGDADEAGRLMATHFETQHNYYREHWPARLEALIEWR
jgi:GntR family transcriptional repressor for pyruvate dehydrogenase complex